MDDCIYKSIVLIQKRNENEILRIIKKFSPLLKKYAFKLPIEDGYEELQLFLIEMLNSLDLKKIKNKSDGGMTSYIHKSVYLKYVDLCMKSKKEKQNSIYMEDLFEEGKEIKLKFYQDDLINEIELEQIKSIITMKEYNVIVLYFFYDIPIEEIARRNGVSRQAINKTKNNGIEKIRKLYTKQ